MASFNIVDNNNVRKIVDSIVRISLSKNLVPTDLCLALWHPWSRVPGSPPLVSSALASPPPALTGHWKPKPTPADEG